MSPFTKAARHRGQGLAFAGVPVNTSIRIAPVTHFVYSLLLVKEHTSISELIRTRSEFLALLTGTLELELRLLHSTEADPKIIAREHGAFAELLDRLAAHPQNPHVQQFSDMNQEEFVRAELDYLRSFSDTLKGHSKSIRELLLIDGPTYKARNSIESLADRMAETRTAGRPNQFTQAQQTAVLRLTDPERYYGKTIARRVFGSTEPAGKATDSATTPSKTPDSSPKVDDPEVSLLRIKARVMTDKLGAYDGACEKVLATALLKVKRWMIDPGFELIEATRHGPPGVLAQRRPGPAMEVFSAEPKDLLFVYHAKNGTRAVFNWGISNATIRRLSDASGLPHLTTPGVSLLLFSAGGDVAGSAYVTCPSTDHDTIGQLALLIKTLDFTSEFMRLAGPAESSSHSEVDREEVERELLNLAEEM